MAETVRRIISLLFSWVLVVKTMVLKVKQALNAAQQAFCEEFKKSKEVHYSDSIQMLLQSPVGSKSNQNGNKSNKDAKMGIRESNQFEADLNQEQIRQQEGNKASYLPLPQEVSDQSLQTFWAFVDSFLKTQNSPHTQRAYSKDLKEFLDYLRIHQKPMNVHTLVEFRERLTQEKSERTGEPLSRVSINRKMATIKSFLNWLVLNGILPNNPAKAVKSFRAGRESPTRDIPNDRVAMMLSLPARHRVGGRMHYAILMLLFHLGLRRSELVGLRTSDVFEQDNQKVLRVRGKGDKERILPLTPELWKSILVYLEMAKKDLTQDQPLFSPVKNNITKIKDKSLHPNAIAYMVKHYAKLAGVHYRVSPHSARATAVSNALDHAAPHRAVQHMAGWSSPLMVTRYDKRKQDLRNSAVGFIKYKVDNDPV